jgi:IclR family mhp operon transcriptional activator
MTGRMTAADLAKRIKVPRTTAHRILDTLVAEGYVIHNQHNHCFQLSQKVRRLAQGNNRDSPISEVARPILRDLCGEILLPVGLTAPVGHDIMLQVSMDHEAPLAQHYLPEGFTFPVTYGAYGRLFLAHCAREVSLELIATALSSTPAYLTPHAIPTEADLVQIRKRGYAVSARPAAPAGILAVPVYVREHYVAGIHLRFPNHPVAAKEAVERYLARLQRAARDIEAAS